MVDLLDPCRDVPRRRLIDAVRLQKGLLHLVQITQLYTSHALEQRGVAPVLRGLTDICRLSRLQAIDVTQQQRIDGLPEFLNCRAGQQRGK